MTRFVLLLATPFLLTGCPWIPEDVHDQFNGDDDDDTDVVDPDDDCEDLVLYADEDGDGWGGERVDGCEPPNITATAEGDCDDSDSDINPSAIELCDGIDNDCNVGTSEVGLVTVRNPLDNQRFDATDAFNSGDPIGVTNDWLEMEINLCTGTYNATFVQIGRDPVVTLRGIGDVTLRPALEDRTLYVQDGTVIVEDIDLIGGTRTDAGGAILCGNSDLTLTDVHIDGGEAPEGGTLHAFGCDVEMERVTATNAEASTGAYVAALDSTFEVTDSEFGSATGDTAFYTSNSTVRMSDTTFFYSARVGFDLSDNGQLEANRVDFPTSVGSDVRAGSTSFNFGLNYSGLCNANGCAND